MSARPQLRKILITYHAFPPIADGLMGAFERRGIEVVFFNTTNHEHWFFHRVIKPVNRIVRSFRLVPKGTDLFKNHSLNQINSFNRNLALTISSGRPDAVLMIHGHAFGESTLAHADLVKIGWHVEPRDDLPYLRAISDPLDVYNSFSQSDVEKLREVGVDARYRCHAVDLNAFYPDTVRNESCDVAFVGNWSEWRDDVVMAALAVTRNVVLYGDYWHRKSKIPRDVLCRILKGQSLVGEELNRLYNSAKVVLNASRSAGSHGLNMRFFEVLGAGGVLLTDPVPELSMHFETGTHLVVYRDVSELKVVLQDLLTDNPQCERLRTAGREHVKKCYTYDAMAEHFIVQYHEVVERKMGSSMRQSDTSSTTRGSEVQSFTS